MENADILNQFNQGEQSTAVPPAFGSSQVNVGNTERIISGVVGGAALIYGIRHLSSPTGIGSLIGGAYLLARGLTGYCSLNNLLGRNTTKRRAGALEITGAMTVARPRNEVYAFWRNLSNLPSFMSHLEEVTELSDTRSKWKAKLPGGVGSVTWEAMITEDAPGERIAWSSEQGSTIDNAGEVSFTDAGPNATAIRATINYRLPGGDVGSLAAKLFSPAVERMMQNDLQEFASVFESGGMPSSGDFAPERIGPTKRKRKGKRAENDDVNISSYTSGSSI